jgi:hypothetical protein
VTKHHLLDKVTQAQFVQAEPLVKISLNPNIPKRELACVDMNSFKEVEKFPDIFEQQYQIIEHETMDAGNVSNNDNYK